MTLKKAALKRSVTPALKSRINWAQIVSTGAMMGTLFGMDSIPPEVQVHIVGVIVAAQGLITFVLNTFFSED